MLDLRQQFERLSNNVTTQITDLRTDLRTLIEALFVARTCYCGEHNVLISDGDQFDPAALPHRIHTLSVLGCHVSHRRMRDIDNKRRL